MRVSPDHREGVALWQFEVFTQFFIGTFEDSPSLLNDFALVLLRNFTSVSGFWFDCVTSIPWSYLDYGAYTVRGIFKVMGFSNMHPFFMIVL